MEEKGKGCLTFFLITLAIGIVIAVVRQVIRLVTFVGLTIWNVRFYILSGICLIAIILFFINRQKIHSRLMSSCGIYGRLFLKLRRFRYGTGKYKAFEGVYLRLTNLLYDLTAETHEELNEHAAFKLKWQVKLSQTFLRMQRDIVKRHKSCPSVESYARSEDDIFEERLVEQFINTDNERYELTLKIAGLVLSRKSNAVSFRTLAERNRYLEILNGLNKSFFICVLYDYLNAKGKQESEQLLDKFNTLSEFSRALEHIGKADYSFNTGLYTVRHFAEKNGDPQKVNYSYRFEVSLANELIKERLLFKHSGLFEPDDQGGGDVLKSKSYTFDNADDAIFRSDDINQLLKKFTETEGGVIRDYVEAKVSREVKGELESNRLNGF